MGLAERRAAKAFQEGKYKEYETKIQSFTDKDLEIDVDWNSLAIEGMSHLYDECWPKVYFEPVIKAFEAICIDDMGKEALEESVDKIVISNKNDSSNSRTWSTFENKTITLDHKPTTNVDQIEDRADTLQKQLEDAM